MSMLTLLPFELSEYGFIDVLRGLSPALGGKAPGTAVALPGLGPGVPTRSARAAIIIALKALGLPPGARVGVPLHCCPVVFKAIQNAGGVPRFLDVDPQNFGVSPGDLSAKSSQLDALIAVHMFGQPCDMTSLIEIMDGRPIIEDCAQSVGSRLEGRPTGAFGAVAAFSFRSGKYLSVGEGGALYTSRPDLRSRISEISAATPAPDLAAEFKHLVLTYIRSRLRSRPLWGLAGRRIWGVYNRNIDFAAKSPIALGQIFRSDLALVRRRMTRLDDMVSGQRANAEYYLRHLRVDPGMTCPERPGTYYNRYIFPLVFPTTGQRDKMAAYLQGRQIGTGRPYEEVIEGAAKSYGYKGDCPVAERLLRRTLVIPNHYRLSAGDRHRIASGINEKWENIGRVHS
jgi:perosamine synthetase